MTNELQIREQQIKQFLLASQNQINSLLADKDRAKKFLAASLMVASNQALIRCTPESIVNALVAVAQLDLNPDTNIGHVYIVPYKDSAQLQIGYKGFIQLLFRAGWLIKAFPVYNCDQFSYKFTGWVNEVNFTPMIGERQEDNNNWVYENMRGVYVVARHSVTNDEYSDFFSKNIIEKIRMRSQNQKKPNQPEHIWFDWYAEMAKKTGIKKLAKVLPLGDERALLGIAYDDRAEMRKAVNYQESASSGVLVDAVVEADHSSDEVNDLLVGGHAGTDKESEV